MNKKFKKHMRLLVYAISSIIFVVSCQEYENEANEKSAKQFKTSKLTMYNFDDTDSIFKAKPFLNRQVKEKFAKKGNFSRLSSETYGFSIDTTHVQVIEGENFESFTFVVERPTYNSSVLENYVLTVGQNGTYTQMLVSYPILSNEAPRANKFDFSNINITFIDDASILYRGECPNSVPEIVEWSDNENCVAHNCGLPGNHSPGEPCDDGEYRSYWECTGAWVVTGCVTFSGGSGNDGTGNQTGGGTGGNENTDPTDTETPEDENGYIGIPISPLEIVTTSCDELANNDMNQVFNQTMQDLKDKANSQNYESAHVLYNNVSDGLIVGNEFTGDPNANGSGREVVLTVNSSDAATPTNSIGFTHCHLDDGTTFKVFSVFDIIAFGEIAELSTRPTSELVMYVTTGSATFAMKINNRAIFKTKKEAMKLILGVIERDYDKLVDKKDTLDNQKLGFLKFLSSINYIGNLGLDLYEKKEDGSWKKLGLSSNKKSVLETNCN